MRWFYQQMDCIAAPTRSIRDELIAQGLPADRIKIVGRGIDHQRFSPDKQDTALRKSWNAENKTVLLYVGRLSEEKKLACLADAFIRAHAANADLRLVLVGDGPFRQRLQDRLAGLPVHFAGVQRGEDLAKHYASSDLFVFPSETDTLGNVVLEAQASGLPALVSSQGGPKDCIQDGATGLIIPSMTPDHLAETILEITGQPDRLRAMGKLSREFSLRWTHQRSFESFWSLHNSN
jgi:glycosyltransferase involved in cell wall biosynthesis